MLKQKVVAAIDFGTHATGYAWAVIGPQNQDAAKRNIRVNTQWKGQPAPYPKTLTALVFNQEGVAIHWGHDARKQYHTQRQQNLTYFQGFKMRLLESVKGSTQHSAKKATGTDRGPSRLEETSNLIATYLELVYQKALKEIETAGFREDEIRWCITVPAMWDDFQKQAMREAAVKAGMPADKKRLILAIEPEAAAHYARVSGVRTAGATSGRRASLMSPNSRFMLVDCGGGTVDITAYRTVNGKLIEIGNDHGGPFGSEYINRHVVDKHFSSRFGSYDILAKIMEKQPRAFIEMLEAWERAKVDIGSEFEEVFLPLPPGISRLLPQPIKDAMAAEQGGVTDYLVLKPDEVRDSFESVLPGLLQLVDRQLNEMRGHTPNLKSPSIIVLVGGFARSAYLQSRLQEHVKGRAEILVPSAPEMAVLMGAAHFAYEPQTQARRSRFTYGIAIAMPFRENVDPPSSALFDEQRQKVCGDRFQIFVRAGEIVEVGHRVSLNSLPLFANQADILLELYRTRSVNPQYVTEAGCEKIGEIKVDLRSVLHLPHQNRIIDKTVIFGDIEIDISVTVKASGKAVEATLNFDPV